MSDQYNAPPPMTTYPEGNGLAIASMVLGIISFVCGGPFTSLPAVICGHLATGKIRRGEMAPDAKGFATAGLVLGYINLVLSVLVIGGYILLIAFALVGSQVGAFN